MGQFEMNKGRVVRANGALFMPEIGMGEGVELHIHQSRSHHFPQIFQ